MSFGLTVIPYKITAAAPGKQSIPTKRYRQNFEYNCRENPMKALSLFIILAVTSDIGNALSIEHENAERRQPEHYSYNQKTDSEIRSDIYYQRAEQERLEQQQREQQRKERQRLDQQRRQLQMENQSKPRHHYDDYLDYDSQRQSDMEQERQQQIIREFYH